MMWVPLRRRAWLTAGYEPERSEVTRPADPVTPLVVTAEVAVREPEEPTQSADQGIERPDRAS